MKKRSLVSAIAMLVVSAIVLTSATFAWFAAGTTAKVDTISATVTNSAGAIEISATGEEGSWTTNLDKDTLVQAGYSLPDALQPVSGKQNAAGMTFVGGSLTTADDGSYTFNSTAAATGSYVMFKVYVRASVDCTVDVDATFVNEKDFIFAAVADASTVKVDSPNASTYVPFVAEGASVIDTNRNSIIDAEEASAGQLGDTVTGTANALDMTNVAFEAGVPQVFTYYMWVEGQHANCRDTVEAAPSLALTFTKNAAAGE